ncbi:DNA-directed RNA polymerase [archaeon]|nr:DNA-directed RNA polymerase [archaeon]
MFYELTIKDHVRVSPSKFDTDVRESVIKSLNDAYEGYVSEDVGFVIGVSEVENVGEGVIVPGDGAAFYETTFKLFVFRPEIQEVVLGRVSEITDFGAFLEIGPIDGMVHVSQAMDDYVSFSKEGVLTGKESKRVLKINDLCRGRIIAASYKDAANPKIGVTMRQHRMGPLKYIEEDIKKETDKKKNG